MFVESLLNIKTVGIIIVLNIGILVNLKRGERNAR